jgi:hypothetical protein
MENNIFNNINNIDDKEEESGTNSTGASSPNISFELEDSWNTYYDEEMLLNE